MQASTMSRNDHAMPIHPITQHADRSAQSDTSARRRTRSHGYQGGYVGNHAARYRPSRFRVR